MAHGKDVCSGCGRPAHGPHICQKTVTAEAWESNSVSRRKAIQFEGESSDLNESFEQLRRYIRGGIQEILFAKDLKRAQEVASSMAVIVDNIRPEKFDAVTARRLADGRKAMALPEPKTKAEADAQIPIVEDGIRALQSLDDLGKEVNDKAWDDMNALMDKLGRLRKKK